MPGVSRCIHFGVSVDALTILNAGRINNNNICLIRRCQNATCYNDIENSQET